MRPPVVRRKRLCDNAFAFAAALCAVAAATPAQAAEGFDATRDPFNFAGEGGVDKSKVRGEITEFQFTLEGLIWDSVSPQAIISGKIVKAGDEVNGAKVLEVTKNGVKMTYKGQAFILKPKGPAK